MTADFEHLVRSNSGRIRRIAMRYSDPGEAEDMVQEILLALWRSFADFRGDSRVETWVYKVALNTALSGVRRKVSSRKRDQRYRGLYLEQSGQTSFPESDILTEFLNSLNEIDASVMMMTLDGMTPQEIKDVIGVSINATTVRINRIKQKYIERFVD